MIHINSQAIYVINNTKEDIDSFEFGWELIKALVKPNMHTRLARGGLSKHLQNSITHILGVENDKLEQPLQMMILQEGDKCALLHLMEKGINQLQIQWAKQNLDAQNANNQFVESIQLPFVNRVPKHNI